MTRTRTDHPASPTSRRDVVLVAAGVVGVIASSIVVQLGHDLVFRCAVGIGVTAALMALGLVGRRAGFRAADALLAMSALSVFGWFSALVTSTALFEQIRGTTPVAAQFLLVNAMKLSSLLVLAVIALRGGWSRRDLFISAGRWSAPTALPHLRWSVAGPVIAVVVVALFLSDPAVVQNVSRLDLRQVIVPVLPLLVLGPVVNAIAEEALYRLAPLATIGPVLGVIPAACLSSVIFGFGHLTGSPPGWSGVLVTTVYGLISCAAILQTRGVGWALTIHVAADFAAIIAITVANATPTA